MPAWLDISPEYFVQWEMGMFIKEIFDPVEDLVRLL